jgi:uncharacterized membrane protein
MNQPFCFPEIVRLADVISRAGKYHNIKQNETSSRPRDQREAKRRRKMSQLSTQVQIKAPVDKLWKVLVDLDSLSQWAPDDVSPDITSENDENTIPTRYYDPDLFRNAEDRAIRWEESHHYAYEVKNVGPIKAAYNRFSLTPVGEAGEETVLAQTLDFQMKFGPIGALMDTLVFRPQFRKQMEQSLAALKEYVERPGPVDTSVDLALAA